ncbi:MAG: hypothetical protein MPK62_13020, partial [Alphaproteobacteria bacterium]|nr:hypothetical protein [Alphaproteobacteria bacterium]
IDLSGTAVDNYSGNTWGNNVTMQLDSSSNDRDISSWGELDAGEQVTFDSNDAITIRLSGAQQASGRFVAGVGVTFAGPQVQPTIVVLNFDNQPSGANIRVFEAESSTSLAIVTRDNSVNQSLTWSSTGSSTGAGSDTSPFDLGSITAFDIQITHISRASTCYRHNVTFNTATTDVAQVFDNSFNPAAIGNETALAPPATTDITGKSINVLDDLDSNNRIQIDVNGCRSDQVTTEAAYGRILDVMRGDTSYGLALQRMRVLRTDVPNATTAGIEWDIIQLVNQRNANMRGPATSGGSDGYYIFIDLVSDTDNQTLWGIYDSGKNFEPRTTVMDDLRITARGTEGEDSQEVRTMPRQLVAAQSIAQLTAPEGRGEFQRAGAVTQESSTGAGDARTVPQA